MASLWWMLGVAIVVLFFGQRIPSIEGLRIPSNNESNRTQLRLEDPVGSLSQEVWLQESQGSSSSSAPPTNTLGDEAAGLSASSDLELVESSFGSNTEEDAVADDGEPEHPSLLMDQTDLPANLNLDDIDDDDDFQLELPKHIWSKNGKKEEDSDDSDDISVGRTRRSLYPDSDWMKNQEEDEDSDGGSLQSSRKRLRQRVSDSKSRFETNQRQFEEKQKPSKNIDDLGKDRSWIGEVRKHYSSDDSFERPSQGILNDDDIYSHAADTIPGIGFLGSGYDLVMGNPLGDEHSPGDPGFKAPVIAFDWGHDKEGVSPDLTTLQPRGGYVRAYVSCQRAEKVEEVESLREYVENLSADALADGNTLFLPFSGSFNFRQMADESLSKQTKTFMMRAYCFRYEAGLASVGRTSSTMTDAFNQAIKTLPADFPSVSEGNSCTPQAFKQNAQSPECSDPSISKWMEFFADFGTHVTTNIKLGGKVTKQIRLSKEQAQDLHNKTAGGSIAAELAFKAALAADGTVSKDSKNRDSGNSVASSSTTYAIGGRAPSDPSDPQELAEWAKSVALLPMPVKYELQPLSRLLPESLVPAYRNAIAFYSKAFGISRDVLEALLGSSTSLKEILQTSTAVTWAGAAPGFVDCPRNMKVLFGFAMHMNMDNSSAPLAVRPCQIGSNRCEGPSVKYSPLGDTRIWAVCGEKAVDALEMFSFVDPAPERAIACGESKVILFGMQMSFTFNKSGLAGVNVAHCSPGAKECRIQDMGTSSDETQSRHMFFATCVGRQYQGLSDLFVTSSAGIVGTSKVVQTSKTAATDCGANASHVTGFTMEMHTLMPLVRMAINACPKGTRYCALNKFIVPPPADSEKRWVKESKDLMHSSLAFGICALKDNSDASGVNQTTVESQSNVQPHNPSTTNNTAAGVRATSTSVQNIKVDKQASKKTA